MQLLYCLILTAVPGPDFIKFVKQRMGQLADRDYVKEHFKYKRERHLNMHPGSGVIVNYATVCLKLLNCAEDRQRIDRPVHYPVIGLEEIASVLARPPMLVTVSHSQYDVYEDAFEFVENDRLVDVHFMPWEAEGKLRQMCGDVLGLNEHEGDAASLYLCLPERTDSRENVIKNVAEIHEFKDIDETLDTPLPIPTNFNIGNLALSDNIADFKFTYQRKLFFGAWYLKVLPIPRIGLPKGKSYTEPLEVWPESEASRGNDFWSNFVYWKSSGLFLSYEMPRARGLCKITETWEEHLPAAVVDVFRNATQTSRHIFNNICEKEDWWLVDLRDRVCRACLVAARMCVGVALRMLEEDSPVTGMKWKNFETLRNYGSGALTELCIRMVPSILRKKYNKNWWTFEVRALLEGLRGVMTGGDIERAILCTIGAGRLRARHAHTDGMHRWHTPTALNLQVGVNKGGASEAAANAIVNANVSHTLSFCTAAEVIAGNHQFLCRRMDNGSDKPGLHQLSEIDEGDRVWIMINPRGLHVADFWTKARLVTVPFSNIIRWSGNLDMIKLDVDFQSSAERGRAGADEKSFKCHCARSTLFRGVMLESIHGMMSYQGAGGMQKTVEREEGRRARGKAEAKKYKLNRA